MTSHQNLFNSLGDMPSEDFRRCGYQFIDWIAEYLEHIDERPVLPSCCPGEIIAMLPKMPPETGETMETILEDIDRVLMSGVTHWNHPNFFAYFSSTGSGPGILGELLSAALNVNHMLWKTCPSASELEHLTLDWLRQMVGLPDDFWGIIYDTASISTFHAIASAREQMSDLQIREKGLAGRVDLPRLCIYTSTQAHSSVDKAAIALGIGTEGVHKIDVDKSFRMQPESLRQMIVQDLKNGWRPFCVVATVGTTSTTSIDPVPEIAQICEDEGLWLHVDAAYGGMAAVVSEMRYILEGCEKADSIVINPHKWLFVPLDLSALYTQKPEILKNAFSHIAEYLRTSEDKQVQNLMDYGLQLGRRFRALKLWFVLRYFGQQGIAFRLRKHLQLAQQLASWIKVHPDFELAAPTVLSTVCFRAHPKNIDDENLLNRLNACLLEKVNQTREIFISHTKLNDKFIIRLAISHLRTEERHIQRAWQIIREKVSETIEMIRQ